MDLLKQRTAAVHMRLHIDDACRIDELTVIEEERGLLIEPLDMAAWRIK